MTYTLDPLPFDKSSLEPHISAKTLSFHYDKHHQSYATNLNNLFADGHALKGQPVLDIMQKTVGQADQAPIYNNAAQIWNHTFFWNSMKPHGGGAPSGQIASRIEADFGGFDKFASLFKSAGATVFGSGYAWLVLNSDGTLEVTKSANAGNPITEGKVPLMTIDVWEHAYYLDYQNRRPDFIGVFLEKLINWEFVEQNLVNQPRR